MADEDGKAMQSARRAQTYTITNACYFSFLLFLEEMSQNSLP